MHLQLCDPQSSDNSPQQLPVNQSYTFRSTRQRRPERQASYLKDDSRYHDEQQTKPTGNYSQQQAQAKWRNTKDKTVGSLVTICPSAFSAFVLIKMTDAFSATTIVVKIGLNELRIFCSVPSSSLNWSTLSASSCDLEQIFHILWGKT